MATTYPVLKARVRLEYDDGSGTLIVIDHALRYVPLNDDEPVVIKKHADRVFHAIAETGLLQA